jgi:XXXCH domain-containing protein
MDDSENSRITRLKMAACLEDLARQFRARTLLVAGEGHPVPEALEGRVELKTKRGRVSLKVHVKWQCPSEPGPPAAAAPRTFSQIKKEMGSRFGELLRLAGQDTLPAPEQVEKFLELCRASASFAEPDWETEMQEFLDHAENLARAHREGSLEMFRHELRDLRQRMQTCHEEFK